MSYSGNTLDKIIEEYINGGIVEDLLRSVDPPITTYKFYKGLKERGIDKRGAISRRYEISSEELLECKNCKRAKPAKDFSQKYSCRNGYDQTRCKICKKAAWSWKKVPIEKRIFNRLKNRSKDRGLSFSLNLDDIILPKICPVFKKKFIYGSHSWTYSVDRFDNCIGYEKDNISIISNKANMIKSTATVDELRTVADWMEDEENKRSCTNISSMLKKKFKTYL